VFDDDEPQEAAVNDQNTTPEPEQMDTPPATTAGIIQDMRSMGEKLAAMVKAAAGTPEAEAVKTDVRQGVEALRQELDKALQRVPTADVHTGVQKGTEVAAGATQRLRGEAAGWLREANRALDKLADTLQGPGAAATAQTPDHDDERMDE
jgi:hypothetical protein